MGDFCELNFDEQVNMMILQQNHCKIERMLSPSFTFVNTGIRTPDIKQEPDIVVKEEFDCVPLDLSVNSGRLSPGMRDSGTESDDSGGRCSPEGGDCKAYKKSLMKRYCKFICLKKLSVTF